ncbi:hypothetical protein D3C87_1780730 [compost metagenome]
MVGLQALNLGGERLELFRHVGGDGFADIVGQLGLFFSGQRHIALQSVIRPSLMVENSFDAVHHGGDPGFLADDGGTDVIEDDLPALGRIAVDLGHAAVAH